MSKHSYYTLKKPNKFAEGGELKGWQKGLGLAGNIAPTLVGAIQEMNPDTSTIQDMADAKIRDIENQRLDFTGMSLDDILNQQARFRGYDLDDKSSDFYQRESTGSILGRAASSAVQGAVSGSSMGPWGATAKGIFDGILTLAGGLFGRSKKQEAADKAASDVLEAKRKKNAYNQASFTTMASNLQAQNDRNLFTQLSAYGGPLGISLRPVDSAIDYMQNEELLTQLGENMTKRNNRRTSMPLFAFGGALGGYGADWSNGLTYIGAGGSHEENPLGGVPAGMSQDGRPNKVEEGEYIWTDQDYVFSKRIEIPEEEYEALGLKKGKRKLTYADGAEILQKESAERPNDPISERSKNAALTKLMQSQEQQRALLAQQEQLAQIEYAMGGGLNRKEDYGTKKKPYPKVKGKDFAGSGRSYPIPTKADAIDALRLAGLHGRSDVKAKVYKKYPELKKALGGHLFWPGGPTYPPYGSLTNEPPLLWGETYENDVPGNNLYWSLNGKVTGASKKGYRVIDGKHVPAYATYLDSPMSAFVQYYPSIDNFGYPMYAAPTNDVTVDKNGRAMLMPKKGKKILSEEAKANIKPFAQSPIKQNPTPIYLSDDSEMNRYIAATNPLAIANITPREYNNSGELRVQSITADDLAKSLEVANTNSPSRGNTQNSNWETWLRYIPILGNSIGLATSWANEPDYSYADDLDTFATNLANEATRERVAPTHIGKYMTYNPFDRLFYANELGAQTAGANSAIMNAGNANMGATTAALLANNYNGNIELGKLFREGEESNFDRRYKVTDFNRATDMFNAEADLKAQIANAEADRYRANILLNAKTTGLGWKQAADQARREAIWANASNLFQGLGDIGWEAVNRNMIVTNPALYYGIDRRGDISYKGEDKKNQGFACGGYLTIKNRRRK